MYKNPNITKCNKKIILFHYHTQYIFSVRLGILLSTEYKRGRLIYSTKSIYNILEELGKK